MRTLLVFTGCALGGAIVGGTATIVVLWLAGY